MKRSGWILLATLLLVGCDDDSLSPATGGGNFRNVLAPCSVGASAPTFCGDVAVPENPASTNGRQLALRIVVIQAQAAPVRPDPVVRLRGGPGGSSTALAGAGLETIFPHNDIVLVDQRGTGGSNAMPCNDPALFGTVDLQNVFDNVFAPEYLMGCADFYAARADLTQYTTPRSADDLDVVLETLGYDEVNLWGISYGTKLALTYMRLHPDRVRSVIIDGVVPTDFRFGISEARDVTDGFDKLVVLCEADPACAAAFPNLPAKVDTLIDRLDRGDIQAQTNHRQTGVPVTVTLNRYSLGVGIRNWLFTINRAKIPRMIERAYSNDDWSDVAQAYQSRSVFLGGLSTAMHLAVICAEDVPFYTAGEIQQNTEGTLFEDFMIRGRQEVCGFWPAGRVPASFLGPVISDAPTLILSGDMDPVTPTSFGEQVRAFLPNSVHVVSPEGAHSAFSLPDGIPCLVGIMQQFVAAASVDGLVTGCAASIKGPPFELE